MLNSLALSFLGLEVGSWSSWVTGLITASGLLYSIHASHKSKKIRISTKIANHAHMEADGQVRILIDVRNKSSEKAVSIDTIYLFAGVSWLGWDTGSTIIGASAPYLYENENNHAVLIPGETGQYSISPSAGILKDLCTEYSVKPENLIFMIKVKDRSGSIGKKYIKDVFLKTWYHDGENIKWTMIK
ncbi:hypothetical protein [Levilactobacillus angrenensis]|uniref:DUF4352 domain-containing protein n=1 Tax=Levilactobacillus angrenensis TaxID=2486020 RepID=A0ABW1UBC6_9LACO|nr:hypothetical protein [Levilactobacillus angrenensis]